jgi:hypothetical protein
MIFKLSVAGMISSMTFGMPSGMNWLIAHRILVGTAVAYMVGGNFPRSALLILRHVNAVVSADSAVSWHAKPSDVSICGSQNPDPTPEKKSTPTPTPDSGVRFSEVRESRMVPKSYLMGGMCPNKHICNSNIFLKNEWFGHNFNFLQENFCSPK